MNSSDFNERDIYLFHQGTNYQSYRMLGAHSAADGDVSGIRFAVWAPHAKAVGVVGDFNEWNASSHQMRKISEAGLWGLFIAGLTAGTVYKYAVTTASGEMLLKADPYATRAEVRPQTASIVWPLGGGHIWQDDEWQAAKSRIQPYDRPVLVYEVHLGSWQRGADGEFLSYREAADRLVPYVKSLHYTHIELLPVGEHPLDDSWGYQLTGYYAVTSRYGLPEDFMYLVDKCHQAGIGVIMDWVPSHFCKDSHGLRMFDGEPLYESSNEKLAENRGWGTTNFDYGRTEVQSFLISNAIFWLNEYHIDGLRIDAVANMLYLNYGREAGEWEPNEYGGDGNLAAVAFLHKLNKVVFSDYPTALMMAEESTEWPGITRPVYLGGMGFNFKWNMGWMNDMLKYMSFDPIYRKWNHQLVTFSFMYAFSENFILPLSHDEVVHGKLSLLNKMPGDYWQKFANYRAFIAYWLAHPGKKLMFMGGEFGQFIEWRCDAGLDWHLLQYPMHEALHRFVKTAQAFYCTEPALWQIDCSWHGFEWIDCNDSDNSVISFVRHATDGGDDIIVLCNFTPVVRNGYRLGVPVPGSYEEVFNTDAADYGGSGVINEGDFISNDVPWHGRAQSIVLTVPPLAVVYFKRKARSSSDMRQLQESGKVR